MEEMKIDVPEEIVAAIRDNDRIPDDLGRDALAAFAFRSISATDIPKIVAMFIAGGDEVWPNMRKVEAEIAQELGLDQVPKPEPATTGAEQPGREVPAFPPPMGGLLRKNRRQK